MRSPCNECTCQSTVDGEVSLSLDSLGAEGIPGENENKRESGNRVGWTLASRNFRRINCGVGPDGFWPLKGTVGPRRVRFPDEVSACNPRQKRYVSSTWSAQRSCAPRHMFGIHIPVMLYNSSVPPRREALLCCQVVQAVACGMVTR